MTIEEFAAKVARERDYQIRKWGIRDHDPFTLVTILVEEVGEVAKAAHDVRYDAGGVDYIRAELIQVAAVAFQFLDTLDRIGARWTGEKT